MKEFCINISGQTEPINFTKNCRVQSAKCPAVKSLESQGFSVFRMGSLNGTSYVFSNDALLANYAKAYAAMAKKLCDNCKQH